MKNNFIKLSMVAKKLGVTKATLYNWRRAGKISFIQVGSLNGLTIEDFNSLLGIKENKEENVVIYARVSSSLHKENLKRQSERLQQYCTAKGYRITQVVEEVASGLNDRRPKLQKIFEENTFTKIVVEHKDRLTRFGFNYLELFAKSHNKSIEVVNPLIADQEDLIQDFVSIITSYCARIYGQRRSKRKTEKLIEELSKDV